MEIQRILENAGIKIPKRIEELYGGLRCFSYLLDYEDSKKVFQLYDGDRYYQSSKKNMIYNMIRDQHLWCIPIPEVIDFKEYKDYSFLLTSYLEGIMLDDMLNINKHIISAISQNLIQYLYSIHSVDIEPFFGWIGDEESPDCSTIEEYLYKEMKRFKKSYVKEFDEKYVENLMSIGENAIENIYRLSIEKPVLLWYDINRKNILIREKGDSYEISGFLDPGGARFGLREWDIAFLKINFCLNDEEFFYILDEYMKIYPALNMSLLKTFEVFVELDNLALQVEDQCIYDIPRNSMFKETLLHLQDKYSN